MFSIRQIVVSTLIFAVVPPAALRAAESAEYVGGTVKSIPVNSAGLLNFDDAKEIRFSYSGSVYSLPYEQITSTEIEKAEGRRLLGKIPVPALLHRKQVLSVNYKDAAGATGSLNFEVASNDAAGLQATIEAKKAPQTAATQNPADWWGDRYWKTNRNQSQWDAKSAQNAQAAPATPSGTK
jgi:hypothetical protein